MKVMTEQIAFMMGHRYDSDRLVYSEVLKEPDRNTPLWFKPIILPIMSTKPVA